MTQMKLTDELRLEYQTLWDTCEVDSSRQGIVEIMANSAFANRARYQAVASPLEIPWHFIAVVHSMESGQNFRKHLHNGDSLTARTVNVPSERPVVGDPPFTWEQSAADALVLKGLRSVSDWSRGAFLFQLERYNGFGYRLFHPETLSPYLWSFTNHYSSGKYVSDGKWDPSAISKQVGACAILKTLETLNDQG